MNNNTLMVLLMILFSNNALQTFAATEDRLCFLSYKVRFFVTNNLPTNLVLRCQDGSHDLGRQVILPNNNFNWGFCDDVFGKSLYFCHLYWGKKQRVFDVYNDQLEKECGHRCYWSAKEDGIYLDGKKKYDWQ